MPVESIITSESGDAVEVRRGFFNGRPSGLVSFTEPLYEWRQRSLLFLDEDGSREMAIDASFGGTPDGVHNGGDSTLWTAAATTGTWDFASTTQAHTGLASIGAFNMSDGDIATISKGSNLDFTNYAALTGWVYITRFNPASQEISLCFMDDSVLVGTIVNLIDYVDTGTLNAWQKFSIPKADLGIADVTIDELLIEFVVNSGSAPRVYFDDIQIEESGGKKFIARPSVGKVVQYTALEFFMVDALAGTVADGTMPGLSYDQILGVPSLTGGITLQRVRNNVPQVAVSFRDLADFLSLTFDISTLGSDGTNTFLKLRTELPTPATLSYEDDDRVEITISDDLSGLIQMRAIVIGRELIPHADDLD